MERLFTKSRRSSRVSHMTKAMKPQIWKNFPEDLFEDVLARLPIATIICFRTVCHQWNNLIMSQRFSQRCAQISQVYPWFYTSFGNGKYEGMYDPFMKRWYYPNTFETHPVSSAGGLVCFVDYYFCPSLYVCMTQSFKKLPNGSIKSWHCLGMTMNGSAGYIVLKLGYDREYEIYYSVTKCWSHIEKIPDCIEWPEFIFSNPVSIDNTFYAIHDDPDGIVSYDMSTGVWTQHLIQAPLHSFDLKLVESDGRIMLVGMVSENDATYVCIWEVQKMSFLWKEVDRVPFSEFYGSVNLTCFGNKGCLLCYLKSPNRYRMITYNIATGAWVKVHVPYARKKLQGFGIVFRPCLTAMP